MTITGGSISFANPLPTASFGKSSRTARRWTRATESGIQARSTCFTIEDQSKERLDCYDAKIAPQAKQVSAPAKTVEDCRFVKEQDERLNCFNRFVNAPSKKNAAQQKRKKPPG
jgi:hypothetical protein